ncbi:S41 family peptidase [Brevundimonas naejangsanensis]|uniref:S41 family peptidase n=1 Tax=Brevundimonas naejangsanensis TaxID=588932 RepID=UPI0026EA4428|nr:PDZ domain-containing protein [Brevundimonas naejangsanensis]
MRPSLRLLSALAFASLAAAPLTAVAQAPTPAPASAEAYREDALALPALIEAKYAYLERLPDGRFPMSSELTAQAEAVHDAASLLRYAESALTVLADHHAITGSSFSDSWAVVPSYADLWIEQGGRNWVITDVRDGSPAAEAGVRSGDRLLAIDDQAVDDAVALFWSKVGLAPQGERAAFAARVLAAGRRDRPRNLMIESADGVQRRLALPNLYTTQRDHPPVRSRHVGDALEIRIDDALGDQATIAAFDAAMMTARPGQTVVLDLTETPSGGNTVVARAIMGWFVDTPSAYQIHSLPAEARETGIERRWIEQVLPRPGKHHDGPVVVRVGRWTGSMGEGLAIGLHAQGARVVGRPMAGLLGAIYDLRLPNSGLVIKIPVERLYAVDGTPREQFRPRED